MHPVRKIIENIREMSIVKFLENLKNITIMFSIQIAGGSGFGSLLGLLSSLKSSLKLIMLNTVVWFTFECAFFITARVFQRFKKHKVFCTNKANLTNSFLF